LELYLSLYNQNNHPYLEWVPYHDANIIGYYLYREINSPSGTILDKLPLKSTSYLDTNLLLGTIKSAVVKYLVKARISALSESLEGNKVSTRGMFIPNKIAEDSLETKNLISYNLFPNYPNPFNPSTQISYYLPKSSFVTLKIYDILGKEIAVLVNERKEAGNHTVEFTAAGSLPSGLCLYKVTAGNYSESKKMTLMK